MCLYAFVQFFMIIDATATFVKEISDVAEIENDRVLVYVSLLHAFLAIIFVSKINVFINEEEQIRFKDKVKKLGLSQSAYIRKIINEDVDNVIHKDEITPILEQIKALNYVCDYE